jgi:putative ABC transport system ATP-binding protein
MSDDLVLHADQVGQTYSGPEAELNVLDGVSFRLRAGQSCAILGPSGSGKTTLLGLCAGLDRPQRGHVHLLGHDLGALDEEQRARLRREQVGFVFQSFQLLPTLTAVENVTLPLDLLGRPRAREQAVRLLEQVGLGARLDHYPAQLSGGEQQRVAVARAFVHQPRILFADEPTGNLDAATAARVMDLLFALNREAGTALLLVTHEPELAARCGRRIRLQAGRLVGDDAA